MKGNRLQVYAMKQIHKVEQKKPDTEDCILCDSMASNTKNWAKLQCSGTHTQAIKESQGSDFCKSEDADCLLVGRDGLAIEKGYVGPSAAWGGGGARADSVLFLTEMIVTQMFTV